MDLIEQVNHILGLVMRHFNSIIAGLEDDPRGVSPGRTTMIYEGDEREYDDAEVWAYGFVEGMKLCWRDWTRRTEKLRATACHSPGSSTSWRRSSEVDSEKSLPRAS